MQNAVIIDAGRTPIGRFLGGLSSVRPDDLAALVIRTLVERNDIRSEDIDEVFFGCANQAGEDNRNVARMAALLAGLPQSVPGVTVNRLCASGLEAVNQAMRMIRLGDAQLCIAGGVESMSRAPYSVPRGPNMPKAGNFTAWDTSLGWRYPNPKLETLFPLEAMGCTAENIVDRMHITRDEQDAFAYQSHQRAIKARDEGWFDLELIPVDIQQRRKQWTVSTDEGPRVDTSLESSRLCGPPSETEARLLQETAPLLMTVPVPSFSQVKPTPKRITSPFEPESSPVPRPALTRP